MGPMGMVVVCMMMPVCMMILLLHLVVLAVSRHRGLACQVEHVA
jgi:hypothetical protein